MPLDPALDTFPKLLLRNARAFADRPAFRHKDGGAWQAWTWAQVLDEVRAYAAGLSRLGLKRGDTVAIVGANRPKLSWTVMAAQALGAIPVPVHAGAAADELAFVLADAGATVAVAQDQDQADTILSVIDRLPRRARILYDAPRGRSDGDPGLQPIEAVIAQGRDLLRRLAGGASFIDAQIRAGHGADPSVVLYPPGTAAASKPVVLSGERCIRAAADMVAFGGLSERDEVLSHLPPAWVGDHYLACAQGLVAGFCMACPRSPETAMQDLREIRPTVYVAPAAQFEALLARLEAGRLRRALSGLFMGVAARHGEAILDGGQVPRTGRIAYGLGRVLVYRPLTNRLGLSRLRAAYAAGEATGLFAVYRSLGLNLKPLYGLPDDLLSDQ